MLLGLGLGYCAAIVISLYVRDELTFDRFIPDADRTYLITADYGLNGEALQESDLTPAVISKWVKSDMPQVASISRLLPVQRLLRTSRRSVTESFYWADSNIFEVLKLPALHGDLRTALVEPGSIVLTRKMALAYFGRDNVIGQHLLTRDNRYYRVTGVLQDFPANTQLDREIFASGTAEYALLPYLDQHEDLLWPTAYAFMTFKNGASLPVARASLLAVAHRHWQGGDSIPVGFDFVRLSDVHFHADSTGEMKPRGHWNFVLALILVAIVIVSQANINFSGLILAETNERGHDMALRTALGARRFDLILAIVMEGLCVQLASALLALAAVERLLPALNKALDLSLSLWAHPIILLVMLAATVVLAGGASSLIPAYIVSKPFGGKRAVKVLSGSDGSRRWSGWVIAQLCLVVVLLISTMTMSQQWTYATQKALNFDGTNVIIVRVSEVPAITNAFRADASALSGVAKIAESWGAPTTEYNVPGLFDGPGGRKIPFTRHSVHPDFFSVYRVPLLAGHNLVGTYSVPKYPKDILVNMATVKALGFASAEAAVGRDIGYYTDRTHVRSRIIGVVPDMRFGTVYEPIQPMIFDSFKTYFTQFNIRLKPDKTAETLAKLDAIWQRDAYGTSLIERQSFQDYQLQQYHELHQQIQVFDLVSKVAILLSTLGLTGLSIFLARHQVREIAIKRALGATFGDILLERLVPFIRPLILANIIAWPVAIVLLASWLNAFASHIALDPASFLKAGVISIAFALTTVAMHSAITARSTGTTSSLRRQ